MPNGRASEIAEEQHNKHLEDIAGVNEEVVLKEEDPDYQYELERDNNL